jgi:hypothetical protein
MPTASVEFDWTFEYAVHGVTLFEQDLKVEVRLSGAYGSRELADWAISDVGVERWSTPRGRIVTAWLDCADPVVKIIRDRLAADPTFDTRVRTVADAYLAEEL